MQSCRGRAQSHNPGLIGSWLLQWGRRGCLPLVLLGLKYIFVCVPSLSDQDRAEVEGRGRAALSSPAKGELREKKRHTALPSQHALRWQRSNHLPSSFYPFLPIITLLFFSCNDFLRLLHRHYRLSFLRCNHLLIRISFRTTLLSTY